MSDTVYPPVPGTEHGAYADPAKVSPKVVVSTLLAVVVPAVIALVTYIGANQEVLGIHNVLLGTFISALIPGVLVFLGGYVKNDPARNG
jgi:hypothetical protein